MSTIPKIDSPLLQNFRKDILDSVRNKITTNEVTTVDGLRLEVYQQFLNFFKNVGSLPFIPRTWKSADFKDSSLHNSNSIGLSKSLDVLFDECRSILEVLINQFTLMTQTTDHLVGRMNSVGTRLNALEESLEVEKFLELDQAVLVISDDFTDLSNVDFNYSSEPAANINVSIASVSLGVDNNKNRGSKVKKVSFSELNKSSDSAARDSSAGGDKLPLEPRAYEGNRFDFANSARPQTNLWRIESKNTLLDKAEPEIEYDAYYSNLINSDPIEEVVIGGAVDEELLQVDRTYYEIFKDAVSIVDKASSVQWKEATGDAITGWVDTADGLSRAVADGDVSVYTATSFTETEDVPSTTVGDYTLISEEGNRFTPNDYIFDEREVDPADIKWKDEGSDDYAKTITREDILYVETDPTETQLEENRMRMFDDDARTFWEIEYTPVIESLQTHLFNMSGDGDPGQYQKYQTEATSYLKSAALDDNLYVELRIELDNTYTLNYIDLSPFFFEDSENANFKVVGIATSAPGSPVLSLEDFTEQPIGSGNNDKLSKRQLQLSGIQNAFAYRDQGFWTFEPRQVSTVFIKIRQDTPIANPYQLKTVQLLKKSNYSISQSKSTSTSSSSALSSKSDSSSLSGNVLERGRTSRLIQMSYLETILDSVSNGAATAELSGATGGDNFSTSVSTDQGNSNQRSTNGMFSQLGSAFAANAGAAAVAENASGGGTGGGAGFGVQAAAFIVGGAALDALLSGGGSSTTSSSTSKGYTDTGWQVSNQMMRTVWKRARYAVGIREIGLYSKVYKSLGTVSSKPYYIPVGDKSITLEVSERIPVSFMEYSPTEAWIEYYIVINGKEVAIAPSRGALSSLPHVELPSSLKLSQYATGDTAEIRFLARLKRPQVTSLLNSDSKSPLLSRYSIQVVN